MEKRNTTGVLQMAFAISAALLAAGGGCSTDESAEPEPLAMTGGGKADDADGVARVKLERCEYACGTHRVYDEMRALYCDDAGPIPNWLNPLRPDIAGDLPPIPEFQAYAFAGDEAINTGGEWLRFNEVELRANAGFDRLRDVSDTNPNKWSLGSLSDEFLWTEDHQSGTWASWPLSIPAADIGEEWSLYAYVPPNAKNTNATYRVYDGQSQQPVLTHQVDQSDYSGARITLFGLEYTAPGWHYLGNADLFSGSSVSLDAGSGSGATFADTVLAVRWGCAER